MSFVILSIFYLNFSSKLSLHSLQMSLQLQFNYNTLFVEFLSTRHLDLDSLIQDQLKIKQSQYYLVIIGNYALITFKSLKHTIKCYQESVKHYYQSICVNFPFILGEEDQMPIFFLTCLKEPKASVIFNAIKDYGQHLKISVVKSPTNDNNCLISFCPPFDINYFYNAKNNLTTILTDESSIEYRGTGYQLLVTNLHKDLFNQEKELYYYFESYGKINHYYLMVDPHNTKMAAVDVVFKKRCDAEKFFNENHKRDVFKCDTQVFVQNLFVFQKDFNKVMGLSNETRKQINPTFFETYDIICYAIDEKLKDDYNETYFGEWLQHFPMTHFKKLDLPTIGRVVLIKFEDPSCVDQLSDPSNFLYNNHQRYPLMLMKYDTNNDVETAIGYHGSELSRTSFQPTTIYVKPISRGQALDRADLKSYFSSFGALVYLFCKDNGSGSYISFYERDSFNKALSSNGDKYSISVYNSHK